MDYLFVGQTCLTDKHGRSEVSGSLGYHVNWAGNVAPRLDTRIDTNTSPLGYIILLNYLRSWRHLSLTNETLDRLSSSITKRSSVYLLTSRQMPTSKLVSKYTHSHVINGVWHVARGISISSSVRCEGCRALVLVKHGDWLLRTVLRWAQGKIWTWIPGVWI
jgi:hypothetical protein